MAAQRRFPKDGLEFARAVTFYDAIFAFAVTLLITTVDDFSPEAWSSLPALWEANGSSLIAFAISFTVVITFWRASHQSVAGLAALTPRIIVLNCVVMFGVVLIPFATEALGKLSDLPLPVAVYAIVIAGTSILHHYAEDRAHEDGLAGRRRSLAERRWTRVHAVALPLVFLCSIPIAYLVSPSAAQKSWLALLVVMPLIGRLEQRALHSEPNTDLADES